MRYIKLRAETERETLHAYFTKRLYQIDLDEKKRELCCCIGKGEADLEAFCRVLSDYMWAHQAAACLQRYLRRNPLLTQPEADSAATKALSVAMSIKEGCDVIYEKLLDYFSGGSRFVILEGFFWFRLKELQKDLAALADLCADELIAKREYEEFITLLRSFVDIQKPSGHEVHLFVETGGAHRLFDAKGQDMLSAEDMAPDITTDS